MKRRLFSTRFARTASASIQARLSTSQRLKVEEFSHYLSQSFSGFVSENCPCGARCDVLVSEVDRYGLPLTTVICERCGTLRTDPYLDRASLDDFYRNTYLALYGWTPEVREYFSRQATYGQPILALYEQKLPNFADVLEVGCGAGGALAVFQRSGYRVAGCDLCQDLIEFGTQSNIRDLWHGTIDDVPAKLACRRFELIYLHHVLEHMPSPHDALRSLASRLKPGGRIMAVVPDITQVDEFPNPAGDILKFLHVAHKFNFTQKCLSTVARQIGLLATARTAPPRTSAWSQMPELWIEFAWASSPPKYAIPRFHSGSRLRRRLRAIEKRFVAGKFANQQLVRPRTSRSRVFSGPIGIGRVVHNWRRQASRVKPGPPRTSIYYVGRSDDMQHHARPLFGEFDVRIENAEGVLRYAKSADVCLFHNEFFPIYRRVLHQLREKQCATIYAIDGILEWRSLWDFPPGISAQWSARPILSHKVACIGRSQARILESWGYADQCEITGVPRFDRLLARTPRARAEGEPFTILVLTAKSPGFGEEQLQRAKQSLIDLRIWMERHPVIEGAPVSAIWRIANRLEHEVGVDNALRDTTGEDLAEALTRVDAMITTPSTSMLEGMLQQIPVALLDYNNCPHYVPAAWRITAAAHLDQVMPELLRPPLAKMLYQQHLLHDSLECDGPALPRLCTLISKMSEIAGRCAVEGRPISFPSQILPHPTHEAPAVAVQLDYAKLFPSNPAFAEKDVLRLQCEVGDLRESLSKFEAQNNKLQEQLAAREAELQLLQNDRERTAA